MGALGLQLGCGVDAHPVNVGRTDLRGHDFVRVGHLDPIAVDHNEVCPLPHLNGAHLAFHAARQGRPKRHAQHALMGRQGLIEVKALLGIALGVLAGSFVAEYVSPKVVRWVAGLGFMAVGAWVLVGGD